MPLYNAVKVVSSSSWVYCTCFTLVLQLYQHEHKSWTENERSKLLEREKTSFKGHYHSFHNLVFFYCRLIA